KRTFVTEFSATDFGVDRPFSRQRLTDFVPRCGSTRPTERRRPNSPSGPPRGGCDGGWSPSRQPPGDLRSGRRAASAEAGRADYISAFRAWTNAVESALAVPWSAWTDDASR